MFSNMLKNKMEIGCYICLLTGIPTSILAYFNGEINICVIGLLMVFLANVGYCLQKFSYRFLFLGFQITMFTFLLSHPIIGMMKNQIWWKEGGQQLENVWFALILVLLGEVGLFVGAQIAEKIESVGKKPVENSHKESGKKYLSAVALIVFGVTYLFYIIEQIEPLYVIGSQNYLSYYTSFESKLPGVFHTISSFMKYSLCIFLATLPNKRKSFIVLFLYVISTIPSLVLGIRNPFMLAVFFSLSYYLLRNRIDGTEIWFGKLEKSLCCICAPVGILFMGMYAKIRMGLGVALRNPFMGIVDFFYGQGVSFIVLEKGYGYRAGLEILKPVNYTFGSMIDYVTRGSVGQKLFGLEGLPSINCEFNALHSNSLSHGLSYLAMREEYLQGRGLGSSYLLENYIDFGFWGAFLFSVAMGVLLIFMSYKFGRNTMLNILILVSLLSIYFIPRAESTSWLTYVVTIQFWLCVGVCYIGAYMCKKIPLLEDVLKRLHLI